MVRTPGSGTQTLLDVLFVSSVSPFNFVKIERTLPLSNDQGRMRMKFPESNHSIMKTTTVREVRQVL